MTISNLKRRAPKVRPATPHDGRVPALIDAPLWSRAQVLHAYGDRSVSWLYAEMAAGRVPRPIRISRNAVAWIGQQIRDDIAAKIAVGPVELTAKPRMPKAVGAPAAQVPQVA